ncbi:MAG: hypothetical protein AVDCRST_MAG18-328, partial [uncultured Thermomicrobiales bacterium]
WAVFLCGLMPPITAWERSRSPDCRARCGKSRRDQRAVR